MKCPHHPDKEVTGTCEFCLSPGCSECLDLPSGLCVKCLAGEDQDSGERWLRYAFSASGLGSGIFFFLIGTRVSSYTGLN